jgi:hypothetical protein
MPIISLFLLQLQQLTGLAQAFTRNDTTNNSRGPAIVTQDSQLDFR